MVIELPTEAEPVRVIQGDCLAVLPSLRFQIDAVVTDPVLFYGKCPYLAAGKGHRPNSLMSYATADDNGHPCPKPLEWMRWLIRKVSFPGQVILDPFGGSGTTAAACIIEGRRCIIIEKEPAYVEIIHRRVAEAMGTGLLAGIA